MLHLVLFRAVGVDAHIDPPETPVLWQFSGKSVLIFPFRAVGVDAHIDPQKTPVLWKLYANLKYFDEQTGASRPCTQVRR